MKFFWIYSPNHEHKASQWNTNKVAYGLFIKQQVGTYLLRTLMKKINEEIVTKVVFADDCYNFIKNLKMSEFDLVFRANFDSDPNPNWSETRDPNPNPNPKKIVRIPNTDALKKTR